FFPSQYTAFSWSPHPGRLKTHRGSIINKYDPAASDSNLPRPISNTNTPLTGFDGWASL
ncbi:uncharacterized protein BDW43DRAFT_267203, partial [Aspergillus alliaceus]|uniref:uncharacterized protein n=1 Tax=Petromyces alliaceus TaxID=209559 RepID=UPI0012A6B2E9